MQAVRRAESLIEQEFSHYTEAALEMPRVAERRFPVGKQRIWYRRIRALAAWLDEAGVAVPPELMQSYNLPIVRRVKARVPLKYQFRALNTLRELTRAKLLFPEYLGETEPRSVLDLSAGGCGVAEVFGHYGHEVKVCDYFKEDELNDSGHSYAAIHNVIGLECAFFDGRSMPYPFETDSYDLVLSYQAIDAYGPVSFWYDAVAEMRRIARRDVGLILNPAYPKTPDAQAEKQEFIRRMQDEHGATLGNCVETNLPALRIPA